MTTMEREQFWAERKQARRVSGYAAKFIAETVGQGAPEDPTDARLAEILGRCGRPAPATLYPAIREKIQNWDGGMLR